MSDTQIMGTKKMSRITAIKTYFGSDREVTTKELKELFSDERRELAEGAAKIMGVELEVPNL